MPIFIPIAHQTHLTHYPQNSFYIFCRQVPQGQMAPQGLQALQASLVLQVRQVPQGKTARWGRRDPTSCLVW